MFHLCVSDIRKHKVLIEDYNAQTQQYQVRHIQEETSEWHASVCVCGGGGGEPNSILIKRNEIVSFANMYLLYIYAAEKKACLNNASSAFSRTSGLSFEGMRAKTNGFKHEKYLV